MTTWEKVSFRCCGRHTSPTRMESRPRCLRWASKRSFWVLIAQASKVDVMPTIGEEKYFEDNRPAQMKHGIVSERCFCINKKLLLAPRHCNFHGFVTLKTKTQGFSCFSTLSYILFAFSQDSNSRPAWFARRRCPADELSPGIFGPKAELSRATEATGPDDWGLVASTLD